MRSRCWSSVQLQVPIGLQVDSRQIMGGYSLMSELTTIDRSLCDVVIEAYRRGYTVQSDFARTHADYIAMAASLGLLSTRLYGNVYSREWRPTVKGLSF